MSYFSLKLLSHFWLQTARQCAGRPSVISLARRRLELQQHRWHFHGAKDRKNCIKQTREPNEILVSNVTGKESKLLQVYLRESASGIVVFLPNWTMHTKVYSSECSSHCSTFFNDELTIERVPILCLSLSLLHLSFKSESRFIRILYSLKEIYIQSPFLPKQSNYAHVAYSLDKQFKEHSGGDSSMTGVHLHPGEVLMVG